MKLLSVLSIFLLLLLFSCAHIRSGNYVKIMRGEDLSTLSKKFKIPIWILQEANQGKKIRSGAWLFIPNDRGIIGQFDRYGRSKDPAQYLGRDILLWPVPASKKVSSKFGKRWGKMHQGIDIAARKGSHILAAESGIVVYSGQELGGYGKITVISHPNGLFTVYAHAKKNFTRKNQKVHRGQVIAQVGSTGRSSGPHLHFEVRYNSKALNPLAYLSK